jgi:hypothetical protein
MRKSATILMVFAALACRRREVVTADGSKVVVEHDGEKVTIATPSGTVTAGGAATALPESFPKDIPVYPGARVTATLVTGGTAGNVATFETAAWPDDVAKFYAGKLAGWKTMMDMKSEDGHTLLLKSPDGKRTLTLAATRQALNTIFTLTVSGN